MNAEKVLIALANRHRIKLLETISNEGNEGIIVSAATELLTVNQPTVTHHLTKMLDAGVLVKKSESHFHIYKINVEKLKELVGYLNKVIENCERKQENETKRNQNKTT